MMLKKIDKDFFTLLDFPRCMNSFKLIMVKISFDQVNNNDNKKYGEQNPNQAGNRLRNNGTIFLHDIPLRR